MLRGGAGFPHGEKLASQLSMTTPTMGMPAARGQAPGSPLLTALHLLHPRVPGKCLLGDWISRAWKCTVVSREHSDVTGNSESPTPWMSL